VCTLVAREAPPPSRSSPPIEKWVKHKEDYHLRYRHTPRTVRDALLWGVAVPVLLYSLVKLEQQRVDERNGRPGSVTPAKHARPSVMTVVPAATWF